MKFLKKIFTAVSVFALTPVIVFASHQSYPDSRSLFSVFDNVAELIKSATFIVASLALLFFFWGISQFILSASDSEKREKGKWMMVWGLIALFALFSVWGILRVLENTLFF